MLAHDRADVLHADRTVVGTARQRRFARLAQERGGIFARELDEEPRCLVADGQPLDRRTLAQPARQLARAARGQLDDRGGRQRGQQPVIRSPVT